MRFRFEKNSSFIETLEAGRPFSVSNMCDVILRFFIKASPRIKVSYKEFETTLPILEKEAVQAFKNLTFRLNTNIMYI